MATAHPGPRSKPPAPLSAGSPQFPTRHYIGAMCLEMARMAKEDGDEVLSDVLRKAAQEAGAPRA